MTGPVALTGSSATSGASATGDGRAPDGGPGFDAAASFVMQVKRRLANEESYSRFIEILRHYHQAKSQSKRTVLLDATRCSQRGSQNWNSTPCDRTNTITACRGNLTG